MISLWLPIVSSLHWISMSPSCLSLSWTPQFSESFFTNTACRPECFPMTKEVKKEEVKAIDKDSRLKIKGMLIGKYPLSISNQANNDLSFSRLSPGSGTLLKILKILQSKTGRQTSGNQRLLRVSKYYQAKKGDISIKRLHRSPDKSQLEISWRKRNKQIITEKDWGYN